MIDHEPNIIHMHLFDQDKVWIDQFGKEHNLCEMEKSYLENVIWFLRKRSYSLFSQKLRDAVSEFIESSGHLTSSKHLFLMQVTSGIKQEEAELWLEKSALMKSLIGHLGFDPPEKVQPEESSP